jgi:carboxypeptidase Taq
LDAYEKLVEKYREVSLVEATFQIMEWDFEVYIPPAGTDQRGDELALLTQLRHRMLTSKDFGALLSEAERKPALDKLNPAQQRNLHLMRKLYDEATALPEKLVAAITKQSTTAVNVWKEAKAKKNWALFKPELAKLVDLQKERAAILQKVKRTKTPYDALIDFFEPKMTEDVVARVFTDLRQRLVPLVDRYAEASKKTDTAFLHRPVPVEVQRQLSVELANFLEYDVTSPKAGGRIDETEHPFTTGYYSDVRITTHYYPDNFVSSMYSVLHECGHALYDQGLPPEHKFQAVGDAASYGIHESQSRFVENIVGRSRPFVEYFLPRLNKVTKGVLKDISVDNFLRAVNRVERSKIRIEADEVTYSLHIIIRFEIERDLFGGRVSVPDLPSVWNDKYQKYLGAKIENDSEGVMQDTHWASGYYGYFPSYALGNIYGGQFLQAMQKDLPSWQDQIGQGKFGAVKKWMVEHVHRRGALYDPEDLVFRITGERLNATPFVSYLENKYAKLFGH